MRDQNEPSGILRIGASSSFSSALIPKLLPEFCERYPKIHVVVRTSDLTENTFELLHQNELDFTFTLEHKSQYPEFIRVTERKEDIVFVTNPANPLAKEKHVPLEKLVESNYISSDRNVSYGHFLEEVLLERGITFHPTIEIGSTSAIINMIVKGDGVSYLPKFLIDEPVQDGALAIIDAEDPGIQVFTQMLRLKNKWVNPIMKVFMDYMTERLDQV